MNTSARIIKAAESVEIAPFPVPSIGGEWETSAGVTPFVPSGIDPEMASFLAAEPAGHFDHSPGDVIQNAEQEASRILAQAEESRVLIEQAALEKAQIDAMAAFEDEVANRVADLRGELVETIQKLASLSGEIVSHVESDLVDLALQIAKKVVRREVSIDREIALTLVRVSLGKLNQRTSAQIHLHPDDLAFIQKNLDSLDFRGALELVEDPSITPGGCLVQTVTGDIDGRVESQFDEIAFGLLS